MAPEASLILQSPADPESAASDWDAFLESTQLGQFQQSSPWARVKELDGWRCHRVVLKEEGRLVGGFQLLWWPYRRFWRIGYVSKGAALVQETPELAERAVETVRAAIDRLRITALLIPSPDRSTELGAALRAVGFLPNRWWGVADANLEIDLTPPLREIDRDFGRSVRQGIRQAQRRGVSVREGGREDLERFFELMSASCRRQRTSPNPCSPQLLERLWDVFQPDGRVRLTLAERGGQTISGLLCLRWRDQLTLWKKGWLDENRDCHANELLYRDAIARAYERGIRACDFAALARSTAEELGNGVPLDASVRRSRDFFNLGLGGHAVLLPRDQALIASPIIRWTYRCFLRWAER